MGRDLRTIDMFGAPPPPVAPRHLRGPEHDGLRYFQLDAYQAIRASLEANRSTLLVLATGLGKTQTFSSVAKHWPGRVLVLAHRDELVGQAKARLEEMTGEYVEIEQGQVRSGRARIVVGSIQTVQRSSRLEALAKRGGFSLIIVDEAHHYVAKSFRRPLDHFKDAKVLGVTATPDRGDAKALGQIFDDVAYTMDICAGIQAGYLVPLVGKEVTIKEVDLDQVSVNAGDLAAGELDEAMLKGVEGVVSGMLNYSKDKQGVIFLPGVKSAHLTAARLNAQRPGCAVSLDGETDADTRRQIVRDFKDGKVQFLSNCMVATEGFDAPAASVIGLARPTKSRAMYAQCAGRGTRVLPGVVDGIHGADGAEARRAAIAASAKPNCLLIDFVGLNTKHSLMTPEDLLGGEYDDAVKQKARKMKEENPDLADTDVTTLLEMSHLELARIAAKVKSRVKASHREFDPFAAFGVDTKSVRKYELEYGYKPVTERQLAFLTKSGFKQHELEGRSFREASKLIDQVIKRREANLASRNQLAALHKRGITDPNISFQAASKALDYIAQNGWGRTVDPAVLNSIVNAKEGDLI